MRRHVEFPFLLSPASASLDASRGGRQESTGAKNLGLERNITIAEMTIDLQASV